MAKRVELPQGTLELLILKSISIGPLHGYRILLRIQQILEWGESENNRRAKFYRLTTSGRRQLKEETTNWSDMADVVANILRASPTEI